MSKTGSELAVPANQGAELYARMMAAIEACHATDECKEIADRSSALAAYYKQQKDDDAIRKVNEIKLRAARRMGQILAARCAEISAPADVKSVRKVWGDDATTSKLGDTTIRYYLGLADLVQADFDAAIYEANGRIRVMLEIANPERVEARQRANIAQQHYLERKHQAEIAVEKLYPDVRPDEDKADRLEEQNFELKDALASSEADLEEVCERLSEQADVGFTLDMRQRKKLKTVPVLLNVEAHEQLRLAGFQCRRTMWSIAREALDMWFVANGYKAIAYHVENQSPQPAEAAE